MKKLPSLFSPYVVGAGLALGLGLSLLSAMLPAAESPQVIEGSGGDRYTISTPFKRYHGIRDPHFLPTGAVIFNDGGKRVLFGPAVPWIATQE